jgi:hypothetical protein
MIEENTAGGLDFGALRDAIEQRDPNLLLGFYSDDAELHVVHAGTPESAAFELRGRAEIARYLRAVLSQRMSSRVEGEAVDEDRISYSEVCDYPDGTRVVVKTTLALREGAISRQLDVVEHSP